mmetsp:Transcript_8228/g.24741  ORF Transcript_8228/g.24741 Transcript_8228/m.24741 type:complete len:290 (+) Transcript_8228:748-1617(+)
MNGSIRGSSARKRSKLVVEKVQSRSVATVACAGYPAKIIVFTEPPGFALAYLVTYGGGLVAGDVVDIDVLVRSGSILFLTSQSSTKVYRRNLQQSCDTEQNFDVCVEENGLAVIAPDPVVCFSRSRYKQKFDISLCEGASVVLVDSLVCGRAARGERWSFDLYESTISVQVNQVPILRERVILENETLEGFGTLAERMAPYEAFATVIFIGKLMSESVQVACEAVQKDVIWKSKPRAWLCSLSKLGPKCDDGIVVRIAAVSSELLHKKINELIQPLADAHGATFWRRKL